MRALGMSLAFASALAMNAAPALADPTADLAAMGQAFASVHSFHADVSTPRGSTLSLDVVQPDKMHMSMNGGKMQVVKIGDDMWMNMRGSWQHMSMGGEMVQRPFEMARAAGLHGKTSTDYAITDEGPSMVDGVPAHKYHLTNKDDGDVTDMWIAKNLPLQIQVTGKDGVSTIKYSQYNSVPDITPPA